MVRGLGEAAANGVHHSKSVVVKSALDDVAANAPCLEDLERNPHVTDIDIPIF